LRRLADIRPVVKYAALRAVDRGIGALARGRLDMHARLAEFTGPDSSRPGITFDQIEPPGKVRVQGPRAAVGEVMNEHRRLWDAVTGDYSLSAAGILGLPGGRFHLPSGIVAVDGRFPTETVPLDRFPFSWQFLDATRALWARARPVEDGYLLTLQLSHGYYHWVCETLPLVSLIEAHDPERTNPIYVGADLPPFVAEYLEIFGVADRCRALDRGVYRAERLLVPTFPGGAEWPSPAHLELVRRRSLDALDLSPRPKRRLLISRADAIDRRVLDEDALVDGLADLGVEPVTLEGRSVAEQVELFHDAELIITPHGAGATNMLFAPGDCGIVELVGHSHYSACYMVIASTLGQPYAYVQCGERNRQLVVDPANVRSAVEAVLSGT
jgi:hypothetical protein